MQNTDLSQSHSFTDNLEINLDMLCAFMLDQISREVHDADIIALHKQWPAGAGYGAPAITDEVNTSQPHHYQWRGIQLQHWSERLYATA